MKAKPSKTIYRTSQRRSVINSFGMESVREDAKREGQWQGFLWGLLVGVIATMVLYQVVK